LVEKEKKKDLFEQLKNKCVEPKRTNRPNGINSEKNETKIRLCLDL
jgi:hypothetical protein